MEKKIDVIWRLPDQRRIWSGLKGPQIHPNIFLQKPIRISRSLSPIRKFRKVSVPRSGAAIAMTAVAPRGGVPCGSAKVWDMGKLPNLHFDGGAISNNGTSIPATGRTCSNTRMDHSAWCSVTKHWAQSTSCWSFSEQSQAYCVYSMLNTRLWTSFKQLEHNHIIDYHWISCHIISYRKSHQISVYSSSLCTWQGLHVKRDAVPVKLEAMRSLGDPGSSSPLNGTACVRLNLGVRQCNICKRLALHMKLQPLRFWTHWGQQVVAPEWHNDTERSILRFITFAVLLTCHDLSRF